ncbi:MAG: thioredoxin fold domain-containing protein [Granulosicoccus sp.]|nr:thioredoxin fold domain-containing protein [Granulosicoccus sp.]
MYKIPLSLSQYQQKSRAWYATLPAALTLITLLTVPLLAFSQSAESTETESTETEPTENGERGQFLGAQETQYPDWFKTSFLELEEDVAEAAEAGKRLMILFHQDNCPYCNAFVEKNLAQKDIEDTLKDKFDVIEINMWGDREVASVQGNIYTEKTFAQALNVQFTPTVLFLTESGELSLRINGYYDPDRFRLALDFVSGQMEKTTTFDEFVRQQESAPSAKSLVDRPYFTGPVTDLTQRPGKGQKPLLLFFEQGSCRNCETLHDTILSKKSSRELLAEFDVYQIDIWGREKFTTAEGQTVTGRELSSELGVSYAPTLILYSAEGEEVIRSEAWFKSFHTQSILDYVASEAWHEQPSFQRYLSTRAEHIQEQGTDVNIFD